MLSPPLLLPNGSFGVPVAGVHQRDSEVRHRSKVATGTSATRPRDPTRSWILCAAPAAPQAGASVIGADDRSMTERPEQPVTARRLPEHPIDMALRHLGVEAAAQDRLEVVWRAFEAATRRQIARPPSPVERQDVLRWSANRTTRTTVLSSSRGGLSSPRCCTGRLPRRRVGWLRWVVECIPRSTICALRRHLPRRHRTLVSPVRAGQGGPAHRGQRRLRAKNTQLEPWGDSPLCLTVTALVARTCIRKDVDNLIKGLLDARQGYLYANDRQVQCLSVRRMEYAGSSGHYLVHAIPMPAWTDDVIFDDPARPQLLSGQVAWPPG